MTATLDEIFSRIREGTSPRSLASELGVTERTFRNRASQAGRMNEYEAVVATYRAKAKSIIDVDALMELADKGKSLNSACVELGYPTGLAIARMEHDGRIAEFYVRLQEARSARKVPVVSSENYHSGPRTVIISIIPKLSDDESERIRCAIAQIDSMISDGARLSRICGGSS